MLKKDGFLDDWITKMKILWYCWEKKS